VKRKGLASILKGVVKINNQFFDPVAVIGYGCVFPPDSYDVKKFWENVLSGKSGITITPEERWKWEYYYDEDRSAEDKTYCRLGGSIENYAFPYEKYKLSGEELEKLNRTQLLLLDTVLQAIEKAGLAVDDFRDSQTGVFVGNMLGDEAFSDYSLNLRAREFYHYLSNNPEYLKLADDTKGEIKGNFFKSVNEKFIKLNGKSFENIMHSALGKAVRNFLGIKGSAIIVDSACSAGVLVIDEAIKHLQNNKLKICITSAVLGNMNVTGNVAFAKIGGISPTHSSPLDHKANGLIPGEGAGTIILKRLETAVKDGDRIYAVIRGVGSASDGKGKSIYAPSSLGQVTAMRKSLTRAGLNPGEIDYIETHATATPVGDKVEINTLKMLYENENMPRQSVALGSIKSQIGHSFSAAGMANLIKVIEGMQHNIMPPAHNYEKTADEIKLEDYPFYVNTTAKPWPVRKQGEPKRACVNAFGFGGINASVVVEEYLEDYHKQLLSRLNETETKTPDALDVAVVGTGVIDSCAAGKSEWWEKAGSLNTIRHGFPENRWNKEINDIFDIERKYEGSFIEKINFPFMKYKIPPIVLPEIDKGQQMALMAAGEAIYEYGLEKIEPSKTGIYVGAMLGLESSIMADLRIRFVEYIEIIKQIPDFKSLPQNVQKAIIEDITAKFRSYIPKVGEDTLPGYMDNIIAGRIANFFNINGTNVVIDSDTTSFMSALEQGIMSLASGENNTAIVGGVHANMTPEFLELFEVIKDELEDNCPGCKTGMGDFVPAEGAVFFILKNYQDIKPGETVYARIKGLINETEFEQKVKFGIADGDKAADILDYSLCCNGLANTSGKRQFYFGAQAGFLMLKAILSLHNGEYKHLNKAGASGNNGSHLTGIYASSILGGDYMLLLDTACTDAKLEFDGSLDKYKSQISGPFTNFTLYLSDDDWDKLLNRINTVLEGDEIESDTIEEMQKCTYRLAVVYKSLEELRRKLKVVS
jgi:acyl transferase domain-containing protein